MPKVSEAHLSRRREQILEAVRRCIARDGIQATTLEAIIAESRLSVGAVYRYFGSKDDIIMAAVAESLGAIGTQIFDPLIEKQPPLTPYNFVATVLTQLYAFSERDGYSLVEVAPHGWAAAQTNVELGELFHDGYQHLVRRIETLAAKWRAQGDIPASVKPRDVAGVIISLILGSIVQHALIGAINPEDHARGLTAFAPRFPRRASKPAASKPAGSRTTKARVRKS